MRQSDAHENMVNPVKRGGNESLRDRSDDPVLSSRSKREKSTGIPLAGLADERERRGSRVNPSGAGFFSPTV